ncbi:MAG TPA: ATP-binding protein [Bryobacteraceae bacterium]|nr:ATP-binding protein [Bryobacteraceae bacterium]
MNPQGESSGDSRYRTLFEQAPVAIWDEDFSAVREFLCALIASGVDDLRQHLESNPDVVADAISRVHVRHVNRTAREFYGAQSEEELIRALPLLFDPAATQVFIDEIAAFAAGASTFTAELATCTLQGEHRLVQMNVSVLPTDRADWSQVIVSSTDLTERRRLEESLERANARLLRLNTDLEQFAYAAAHDLREPLRTITLYAQLLQTLPPEKSGIPAATALTYIRQNSMRMQTLIDDMLAFARAIEPDNQNLCLLVDSNSIAAEVLTSIAGIVGQSKARVGVSPGLPGVPVQAGHLRQVFQNLILNAIKYRSPDRRLEVFVTATERDSETLFCVSDNGIGIPPEHHTRIFGIFARLHGASIEGNGIGLAVCKKIVEKYGGHIWVESQVGAGSKFYFTIPGSRPGPAGHP